MTDLQKQLGLEELWLKLFPNVGLPDADSWRFWLRKNGTTRIANGFIQAEKKFERMRASGREMSREYIVRFASTVMSSEARNEAARLRQQADIAADPDSAWQDGVTPYYD
jgi:hypothetical protein